MLTAKESVRKLLDELPDDCTLEDIQYQLYVIEKIKHGLEQAESGETIPHDEVKKKYEKWLEP